MKETERERGLIRQWKIWGDRKQMTTKRIEKITWIIFKLMASIRAEANRTNRLIKLEANTNAEGRGGVFFEL